MLWLLLAVAVAQAAPQNPSPMSDSTRPHPRVAQADVPGRRTALTVGRLFIGDRFAPDGRAADLVVHFHGAPWLIEYHASRMRRTTVLVTVQLGAGSRAYSEAFADPEVFERLLGEAADGVVRATGRPVAWRSITVSSFSAGYGAVRAILRSARHYARVDRVLLADSLHASYVEPVPSPRTGDLPVDESGLEPFIHFAADAVAGRKELRLTHSEVFPGTFASTTETAEVLLRHAGLRRRRVLRDGPIGMQQLSEARRGKFAVKGFAGNSAPDHLDHVHALRELLWK